MNILRLVLFAAALAYLAFASHGHAHIAAILASIIIPFAVGIGLIVGKRRV